jgi:aspartyl-tRNA(Asn)/glutamyl-tRNA(Gln) amidotransferase subunit A
MNRDLSTETLAFEGAAALSARLERGETTSLGLTEMFLGRIRRHDKALNSYLRTTAESAVAEARAADARRAVGLERGPLDGVPVALKDNIDVAGVPTTAGVEARRHHVAARDATVSARLKAAGAVILGKLNMHEGAHGATTANEAFGYCYNPHRPGFTPGGSSGGSGAAVAAGLCAAAVGSDTLGSIRIPSSFCGVSGIKPTHGAVSTAGVVPLAFALDHVGPLGHRVADLALMLEVMAAPDVADPFSAMAPRALHAVDAQPGSLAGLRLGRLTDLDGFAADAVHADIVQGYERALAVLRGLGASIVDVSLGDYRHNAIRPKAMLIIEADLALVYADELEKNLNGFSPVFRDGVAFGRQQSAPKLAAALETLRAVKPIAHALFAEVDALITPTTPCTAFSFTEAMPKTLTAFTAFANYTGAPAVSVPMGFTEDRLPMGLQIAARPWNDMTALKIAAAYEAAAGHKMRPPNF